MRFTASNTITERSYGRLFAEEMAACYGKWIAAKWHIEVIIPVPLHPSKKRKRGFNQAEILAGSTGRSDRNSDSRRMCCSESERQDPRKMLDPQERRENLKGAFAVSKRWKPCRNVLLIDDIYTTGSTIEQLRGNAEKGRSRKCLVFNYKHWTRCLSICYTKT